MKIQVIDIRKHDPEKVVAYWVSKGGIDKGYGRSAINPFVGIDNDDNVIGGWSSITKGHELIDLPETEPALKLVVGKDYKMRNGEKVYFVGVLPDNRNAVYHYNGWHVRYYNGTTYCDFDYDRDYDIIAEWPPEPREWFLAIPDEPIKPVAHDTEEEAWKCVETYGGTVVRVREVMTE